MCTIGVCGSATAGPLGIRETRMPCVLVLCGAFVCTVTSLLASFGIVDRTVLRLYCIHLTAVVARYWFCRSGTVYDNDQGTSALCLRDCGEFLVCGDWLCNSTTAGPPYTIVL